MGPKGSDRHPPNIIPARTSSSFYKIILPSIIHDNKLRIPEKFAKKYGNELSPFAVLTVPNGQIWHVGVEKADNKLWFRDGWKEFMEHHSIRFGFFLVFKYEGNSKFNVVIFDLTAAEIHYPRNTLRISEEPNDGKQYPVSKESGMEGDDDSVEILCSTENKVFDECLDQQKVGKKCFNSSLQEKFEFAPGYDMRSNKHGRCVSSLDSLRSNPRYLTRSKRHKMEDLGVTIKLENVSMSFNGKLRTSDFGNVTASCKGKLRACDMPNSHGSLLDKPKRDKWNLTKNVENLQATVPLVQDLGLSSGGKLKNHINKADIRGQHLTKDSVFVQMATQRSEGIGSQFKEIKHAKNEKGMKLLSSDAANQRNESNGQQITVKREEEVELLGVNTSRNVLMRSTTQERENAVKAAMMFKPENPFFMVILQSYNVHHSFILNVPTEFARNYLHGVSGYIKLQVSDGKQWNVRWIYDVGKVQCLSKGWATFVRENHLVEGDVCIFELIQVKDAMLKVSIFHTVEDARR